MRSASQREGEEHCQVFQETDGLNVSPVSINRTRMTLGWARSTPVVQVNTIHLCGMALGRNWTTTADERGVKVYGNFHDT